MEIPGCYFLLTVLFVALPDSVLTEEMVLNLEVGHNTILTPSFYEVINRLLWKYNGNLVAEWESKSGFDYYGQFRDRTTLDQTTGRLEITNMSRADAGLYTVEINSIAQDKGYKVQVFNRVPKPEVAIRPLACQPASYRCNLSCAAEPKDADPFVYSWKNGDGEWKVGGKNVPLDQTLEHVKSFTCKLTNPINEEESGSFSNPIFKEETTSSAGGVVAGVVITLVLILALVLGVGYWKRAEIVKIKDRHFPRRGGSNPESPAEARDPLNGNSAEAKKDGPSE